MKRTIDILLREHVRGLGRCGDVVSVAPGYAHNYLLPQRLAVPATEDNRRQIAHRAERLALEEAAQMAEIEAAVATLSKLRVKTVMKADEGGHLYGSVNASKVAELVAAAGAEIEEKRVHLDAPIKAIGDHYVEIHVHGEHYAQITVTVEPEEQAEQASASEG